jgi:ADP-heptose:LPS heptosyltransferase
LIGLLGAVRLFVGDDTSPTHIAAARDGPVAEIFGLSNPVYWRPSVLPPRFVDRKACCEQVVKRKSRFDLRALWIALQHVLKSCLALIAKAYVRK